MESNSTGKSTKQPKSIVVALIGAFLLTGIFFVDLLTPLGIADGISYVAIVLLTIWVPQRRFVYYAVSVSIALVILGFLFSPKGENMNIVVPNRVLAILAILGCGIIILAYKRTQELATKTREQLEALFVHANEGIIIIDESRSIVLANPGSAHLFRYPEKELAGINIHTLLPEFPDRTEKIKNRSVDASDPRDIKQPGTGQRKDGSNFPVEFSFSQYHTSDGIFTVVFVMDITRRKRDEEALLKIHRDLEASTLELKRSNKELENFAYISSHDLQEPLRKIQSFGHRLKEAEQKNLSEQSTDYLNRMLNAASRMQNLINDLLLFSRVTSRKQSFSEVNLQTLLDQVLTDLELVVEQNHTTIEASLRNISIEADPTQMRQLFQNLLTNAIKFRKEKEDPVLKIDAAIVTVPGQPENKFVQIHFEDNGIGFDEKYADRIFTIFQRLDGQKYPGSGIGLAICMKIVHHHGGIITVKSTPGKGSRFSITLPVTQRQPVTEDFINKVNNHERQFDTIN